MIRRLLYKLSKTGLLSAKGMQELIQARRLHGTNLMTIIDYAARMFPEEAAFQDRQKAVIYRELFQKSYVLAQWISLNHNVSFG